MFEVNKINSDFICDDCDCELEKYGLGFTKFGVYFFGLDGHVLASGCHSTVDHAGNFFDSGFAFQDAIQAVIE